MTNQHQENWEDDKIFGEESPENGGGKASPKRDGPNVNKTQQTNKPFSKRGIGIFILIMGVLTIMLSFQVNRTGQTEKPVDGMQEVAKTSDQDNFSDMVIELQRQATEKNKPAAQATSAPGQKRLPQKRTTTQAGSTRTTYQSDAELAQAAKEMKKLKAQAMMGKSEAGGFGSRSARRESGYAVPASAQASTAQSGAGPNQQLPMSASEQKINFLLNPQGAQQMTQHGYSTKIPVPQQFQWELKAGTMIPTILMNGVDSSIPGMVRAQVAENVWDSTNGSHVLIPKGTMAIGVYNTDVRFGDRRIMFVWNRLIFPNGTTLDISGTAGTDQSGYGGVGGRVNEHWDKLFLSALISSLFIGGAEVLMDDDSSYYTTNSDKKSTKDIMAEALAANILDINSKIMERALNVAPTIRIRSGKRMGMFVNQDIIFPAPYPMDY